MFTIARFIIIIRKASLSLCVFVWCVFVFVCVCLCLFVFVCVCMCVCGDGWIESARGNDKKIVFQPFLWVFLSSIFFPIESFL